MVTRERAEQAYRLMLVENGSAEADINQLDFAIGEAVAEERAAIADWHDRQAEAAIVKTSAAMQRHGGPPGSASARAGQWHAIADCHTKSAAAIRARAK